MDIIFYTFKGHEKSVNKILNQVKKYENILLLDNTSVKNPTIIIDGFTDVGDISNFNYAYIGKFKRYYFVSSVTINRNRAVIELSTDVLMTAKNRILATTQLIERSEKYRNKRLVDNQLPLHSDNIIYSKVFGNDVFETGGGRRIILQTNGCLEDE